MADEVTLLIANREKELNGDADRIRTDRYIQELKPREESLLDRIVRLQLEISETEHLERLCLLIGLLLLGFLFVLIGGALFELTMSVSS